MPAEKIPAQNNPAKKAGFFLPLYLYLYLCFFASDAAFGKTGINPGVLPYSITNTYPHDSSYFTQGLLIDDEGWIFESSGKYGHSFITRYQPGVLQTSVRQVFPANYFLEGITLIGNQLYLGSWRENTLFTIDPDTLAIINKSTYRGEIWGLATDGKQLLLSDGSDRISFIDPASMKTTATRQVKCNGRPVIHLNELEWINPYLLANIWYSDRIAVIDSGSFEVVGIIDLSGIAQDEAANDESVLNGIAWHGRDKRLLVTGKNWQHIYELKVEALVNGLDRPAEAAAEKGLPESREPQVRGRVTPVCP